jgi:hypothetical protein
MMCKKGVVIFVPSLFTVFAYFKLLLIHISGLLGTSFINIYSTSFRLMVQGIKAVMTSSNRSTLSRCWTLMILKSYILCYNYRILTST